MTHAIRERGSAFRSKKTIAGAVAAGVGAAALALGAPLAAHAATQITSGHVDIVSVNSTNQPGTTLGSSFNTWPVDYEFVYNVAGSDGTVSCDNNVWSVDQYPSGVPELGLSNQGGASTVALNDAVGSANPGDVRFVNTGGAPVLNTATGVSAPLPVHTHYELQFDGSCDADTLSYDVEFEVAGAASGVQNFTLTINN